MPDVLLVTGMQRGMRQSLSSKSTQSNRGSGRVNKYMQLSDVSIQRGCSTVCAQ